MVAGSPSGFFTSNRGNRQGDTLSPYIFVLVMELWTVKMELAHEVGYIQSIKRGPWMHKSDQLVADMLVFYRAHKGSLEIVSILLSDLALNTGLVVNRYKSKMIFSMMPS